MPTIPGIPGPYRFFFYSLDCWESPHIHVERDDDTCKFWLDPVRLDRTASFSSRELNVIREIIFEHRPKMLEIWDEHCRSVRR